jgi:HEAT repeats
MNWRTFSLVITLGLALLTQVEAVVRAADEAPEELLKMIASLLVNKDREFQAAGLDYVRKGAQGEKATKLFIEQLSSLPAESQALLLNALSDRGDVSARSAVIEVSKNSKDESVRAAAILALGSLGSESELPMLAELLASKSAAEQAAARESLSKIRGEGVSKELAKMLSTASGPLKASLIDTLSKRRAKNAVEAFVAATTDDNPKVREAAMNAIGQLGGSDHITLMLPGILKATKGGERDNAEKQVALVCSRIDKEDQRAEVLIKALKGVPVQDRDQLLSLVGRVGGKKLVDYVGGIATDEDTARRKLAIDALSKWPDGSVAKILKEITQKTADAEERNAAFQAYIKVCAARDKRSDKQRLESMKEALDIAKTPEEKKLVINRSRTAYAVETLRFVLPFLDDAQFDQITCETIVELAHHREVRDPNKAEFDKALDKVIEKSKNATVVERAKAYKKGETWSRS